MSEVVVGKAVVGKAVVGKVVVGVDGSEGAKSALRWAVRYAQNAGATLDAVAVWDYPVLMTLPAASTLPPPEEMAAETLEHLRRSIEEAGVADPGSVPIRHHVVRGHPAESILKAAEDAELVVVGHRGLGGFGSLVLGSVSQQILHHAKCPVVVVPLDS